jgi:hypothetical protein
MTKYSLAEICTNKVETSVQPNCEISGIDPASPWRAFEQHAVKPDTDVPTNGRKETQELCTRCQEADALVVQNS